MIPAIGNLASFALVFAAAHANSRLDCSSPCGMLDVRQDLAPSCTIGAELVGDDALGCDALLFQETGEQPFGRLGVASALENLIEHIPVLIDRAPQPVFSASNRDGPLIEVPDIISAGLLAAQAPGVVRPELLSHRRIVS